MFFPENENTALQAKNAKLNDETLDLEAQIEELKDNSRYHSDVSTELARENELLKAENKDLNDKFKQLQSLLAGETGKSFQCQGKLLLHYL